MKKFAHILWGIWCVFSMIVSPPWLLMTFANITGLIYKYDYTMDEGTAGIIGILMFVIWVIFVLLPLVAFVKYTFKKKKLKGYLLVFLPIIISIIILLGAAVWRTGYAKTEILTSSSEDGKQQLVVYMIGEPDWPFGPTHCQFDLMVNGKKLVKYPFSVRNDGVRCSENNFEITWNKENVKIIVSGEEQNDVEYILNFDGTFAE